MLINKQTISWSIEHFLPKSQSIAGWLRWFCFGLQSTTGVLEPLASKSDDTFTFISASNGKKRKHPNYRLLQNKSLTFWGEKTLDPGYSCNPDQEDNNSTIRHKTTMPYRYTCYLSLNYSWSCAALGCCSWGQRQCVWISKVGLLSEKFQWSIQAKVRSSHSIQFFQFFCS